MKQNTTLTAAQVLDIDVYDIEEKVTLKGVTFEGDHIHIKVTPHGKAYHYSGRNRYGEWIEPEEHGFRCTSVTIEEAYFEPEDEEFEVDETLKADIVEVINNLNY